MDTKTQVNELLDSLTTLLADLQAKEWSGLTVGARAS